MIEYTLDHYNQAKTIYEELCSRKIPTEPAHAIAIGAFHGRHPEYTVTASVAELASIDYLIAKRVLSDWLENPTDTTDPRRVIARGIALGEKENPG